MAQARLHPLVPCSLTGLPVHMLAVSWCYGLAHLSRPVPCRAQCCHIEMRVSLFTCLPYRSEDSWYHMNIISHLSIPVMCPTITTGLCPAYLSACLLRPRATTRQPGTPVYIPAIFKSCHVVAWQSRLYTRFVPCTHMEIHTHLFVVVIFACMLFPSASTR